MSRRILLALVIVCCAGRAGAAYLRGSVFLFPITSTQFNSWGSAQYHNDLSQPDSRGVLSGEHSVHGPQVFETPVSGAGSYSYALEGPAQYGACYGTTLHVRADAEYPYRDAEETWSGDTKCAPPAPPPIDPPDPITLCDDGSYSGQCSPVVINLESGRYTLAGLDDPVNFDINADGTPDRITWTARETPVAFLALDRNGNIRIDNGAELFGDSTPLITGRDAATPPATCSGTKAWPC